MAHHAAPHPTETSGPARPLHRLRLGVRRSVAGLCLIVFGAVVGLSACGTSSTGTTSDGRPTIIATTPLLGDLVKRIGGDGVDVQVLIPRNVDPHDFEASASQAARLRDASLIVANGLGLEERLESTLESAADDGANLLEVGPQIDPLLRPGTDEPDPHFWLDPERMSRAASLVADALARSTDIDRATLDANAAQYSLDALNAGIEAAAILDTVPETERLLVTNHDALEYFATRFRYKVIGTIIPGGSTLAEPSATDIRDLVATIRASGVRAIFSESTTSSKLADTVGRELGSRISIIELSTDTLGDPGSSTGTYPGLIVTTARRIADGLNGR